MSVLVEINSNAVDDLRGVRVTMSRVPVVDETIRILSLVNDLTTACRFRVLRVTHNANTSAYPKREQEIDAWVDCVTCEE